MPLGDYPAGEGPAGFDPAASTSRASPPGSRALYIDLATRTILYDVNGFARAMHPVDQTMALCVGIPLGSIPSVPDLGLDVQRMLTATPAARQSVAEDAVNVAAAAPIAAGDVTILAVVMTGKVGPLYLRVDYRNNRTGAATSARFG